MSSHELAEVEEAATHVAYLEHGRLLFQEAKLDLVKRFREVRATLKGALPAEFTAPPEWLDIRVEDRIVSFVDTRYANDRELAGRITALTGEIQAFETRPTGLRAIFTALARAMQDAEA
jgi:ABC-type multidrug transport system ATPase subunit